MAKLPFGPAKAMGKEKAPRPLFNEHSILRRPRIARAAAEEEQRRLPLQKVNVRVLPLEWARRRLKTKALWRFDAVWGNVLRRPETHSSKREPGLRISEAEAGAIEGAGATFEASQRPTGGLVVPFAVVEKKPAGPRSRFIARLKGKNGHGDREADRAPLQRVSRFLDAALGEVEAVSDLKASFFRVGLPQGGRASFRCRAEAGRFVELARALAGDPRWWARVAPPRGR
ncbi:hypothetical protein ERJ75_001466500 [Trypanosoma vivax]|nr:hypothetical protein ERJ75_001466500 [Trypanosoma vivax]